MTIYSPANSEAVLGNISVHPPHVSRFASPEPRLNTKLIFAEPRNLALLVWGIGSHNLEYTYI